MNAGRRLVVNDARADPVTSELTDPYLLENDIYSMLDVPVFYDGTIIGVVCHEHVGGLRQWAVNEQEFSSLIASDISLSLEVDKRKAIEKSLEHQAHHDSLTGLPNRNLLLMRIEQAARRATQEGSLLAVLFLDLDNFKQINDSFGHSFGDDVLVLLAQKLQGVLRESDTVARLGGDEFTFLLCGLNNTEEAGEVALKLFEAISQPLIIQGCELFVTASIGISVFPEDGNRPEVLLRNADAAMYRAKENGQNTFEFYAEYLTQRALAKVLMIADLHRALDRREFEMYYQPQYDIQSKQLVGFEALVRWRHPELGFILPEDFLSVSEESGLIVALDRWVLCEVLQQIREWHADGFDLKRISLNLTMQQIDQPDFMEFLMEQMKDFDCKGESLGFEVTEGHLMKHPERTIGLLRRISDLGIKISIDDFGAGYSSLGYLKKLPVDTLKIDKEFILGIPEDEDDAAIVRAIIALAKSMKIEVMAEGIETIEQFEFLKKEGCGCVQGYLLSQPISASDVVRLASYPLD